MVNDVHEPNPDWDCLACGNAWPCAPARDGLLAEHSDDPGRLAMMMCRLLGNAAAALGQHPDVMFERFIAWTKPVPLDRQQHG